MNIVLSKINQRQTTTICSLSQVETLQKNLKVELGLLLGTGKGAMAWQQKVDGYDKDTLYIVHPVIFRTF